MKTHELRQIIREEISKVLNEPSPKYYAVFNYLGEYNNGVPLYIITNTKEEMIDKLNKSYKKLTGETYVPYSMDDMEGPVSYMGEPINTYISDDWATVTYNESIFKNELKRVADYLKKQPEQYREEIRKVVDEAYNEFLDTDEGGWMREYIDKIAKNLKLDLDYRKEFDDAFELALTKLKENYPKLKKKYPDLELDFEYIVANKESLY